jgi:hypothetical protein
MTSIELVGVEEHGPDHLLLAVEVVTEDGKTERVAHFMPKDTAEWRIAEYDLDPDDHDTVIDVLLHEAAVHAEMAPEDTLHQAPSVEHAREALLGAVRARKAVSDGKLRTARKGKKADPEKPHRARLKELFLIEPEVVEAKRAFVRMLRERTGPEQSRPLAHMPVAQPPRSAAERAAHFHQAIQMNRSSHADADLHE